MPSSPSPALTGAPRRAAVRGLDGQRRNPADVARDMSDELDEFMRLESVGPRSTADHERLVALAEAIAARGCALRAHYRGPSTQPCRAPLSRSVDGTKAAW